MTIMQGKFNTDEIKTVKVDSDGRLETTSIVNVDDISIMAEMKVDSGHDLYLATNVTRTGNLAVSFDAIPSTFTLNEIQSVENKTKGYVYNTAGATLTSTSITLSASVQKTGYPVIAIGDIIEVVYRGESRLDMITETLNQLLNVTNLNAVTVATNGTSVETAVYRNKVVYVNVSVNTGAVTVNIEISPDGTTWWNYDSKTYTGITALDSWAIDDHFPFMRTTTATQSNATVTTFITGRGL